MMTLQRTAVLRFAEALLITGLVVVLLRKITGYDLWAHLAIGREIFERGWLPDEEFLVYPNTDVPGAYHEWGFGLIQYLVYRVGEFWGLSLANALIGTATLYVLFRASMRRPWANPAPILVLVAVVSWAYYRLNYRPEIILYLSLAVEILLLERFLQDRRWRWLAPIPFIAFLLAQAHPSVLFVLLILGAYGCQLAWELRSEAREILKPGLWFVVCALLAVGLGSINPYGLQQIILPFSLLGDNLAVRAVIEFKPSLETEMRWPYVSLAVASFLAVTLAPKRRVVDCMLFLLFAFLAFRYVRNIGFFALIMYIPMTRTATYWLGRLRESLAGTGLVQRLPSLNRRIGQGLWVMAIGVSIAALAPRVSTTLWGAGPFPGLYPETAVRLISKLRPPGRIFNFYNTGGYLAWRLQGDYQVFIDGRHMGMDRSFLLHNQIMKGLHGWPHVLDSYDVNTIVMPITMRDSGALLPLVGILAKDPEWGLAAVDDGGLVFFRRDFHQALPAQYHLETRRIWRQAAKEGFRYLKLFPDTPHPYRTMGEAMLQQGNREMALDMYRQYLELSPEDTEIVQLVAHLESQ
jgi:hypothetical protein